ncbi:hypothetical protein ACRCPS_17680 [Pseudomonas aeruginosa]
MRFLFSTPRSISALKSAASKLRKASEGLKQTDALNQAAVAAGFANYTHAQRILPEVMPALTLVCAWREGAARGIEQLKYPMPWSAAEIAGMKLKAGRIASFVDFEGELDCNTPATSQESARYWLVQALRELMVMEATGLRPVRVSGKVPFTREVWSGIRYNEPSTPPGEDHLSAWQDPVTRDVLLMDEPYLDKGLPHPRAADRAVWCKKYGYEELNSTWGGTYLPPRSNLFMLARKVRGRGIDLAAIEEKLSTLPDDFGSTDEDWKGVSLSPERMLS